MATASGYNPIRYDCEQEGCFNRVKRPKLEVFAECFPGRIAMSDVDGIVEIGGHILMLEWRCRRGGGTKAQEILAERFTASSPKHVYLEVVGDAETMEVTEMRAFRHGECKDGWQPYDLPRLIDFLRRWAHHAKGR